MRGENTVDETQLCKVKSTSHDDEAYSQIGRFFLISEFLLKNNLTRTGK